jgi:hypothetical protein
VKARAGPTNPSHWRKQMGVWREAHHHPKKKRWNENPQDQQEESIKKINIIK